MTTTVARERVILDESFDLPLRSREAFRLFTARGERRWVPEWSPSFFADVADDSQVGTVFRTHDDSGCATTWVVVDRELGSHIRYARVVEHRNAGMVDVTLHKTASGCRVTVTYDLTSIDADGDAPLRRFADEFVPYIRSWAEMIVAYLDTGGDLPGSV